MYQLRVRMSDKKTCQAETAESKHLYYKRKRQLLKGKPEAYKAYKQADAERSWLYRKRLTPNRKKRNAEKSRLRMQAMRQRRKAAEHGTDKKKVDLIKTRKAREKLRTQWRIAKQKQRANKTAQAKRRELESRRERYKVNTAKRRLNFSEVRVDLSPEAFAEEIETSINEATPRKQQVLKERKVWNTPRTKQTLEVNARIVRSLRDAVKTLRKKKTLKGKTRYRWLVEAIASKYLNDQKMRRALDIHWHFWKSATEIDYEGQSLPPCLAPKSDSMPPEVKEAVQHFYLDQSTTLPARRTVSAKTLQQKSVLNKTTAQLHTDFVHKNKGKIHVSLSHFRKLRPKHCLIMDSTKFKNCLCEYCVNVELKLKSLGDAARRGVKVTLKNKFEVINASMCDKKGEYHDKNCIERNCMLCGVAKIKEDFHPLEEAYGSKTLAWQRWQNGTVTDSTGKTTQRKILLDKSGTVQDCITELCDEASSLSSHLFIAEWQRKQFTHLKETLPKDWLLTIADFAENYRCTHQDEIQAAYYMYQQATVHPMVGYYKCPSCEEAVVEESVVFITPDLKHDAYAVRQFTDRLDNHIKKRAVDFRHQVQFSDGCASQYKSKLSFMHVSERSVDGSSFERVYFGSRHGKGPCDALGGVVKKAAEKYVKSRQGLIRNAKEFYDFCISNLVINPENDGCKHKRRVFFYEDSILRPAAKKLKTVKGTRQLHSVRSVKPGVVQVRKLGCYCTECVEGKPETCKNGKYVDKWEEHVLDPEKTNKISKHKRKESKKKKEMFLKDCRQI